MENEDYPELTPQRFSELDRLRAAMDAMRNLPPERAISAMPVIVPYMAIVGRVEHYKRGEEHCFRITRTVAGHEPDEIWEEKPLNAHAVRDEFLNVKDWSGAYDFLTTTGIFSPLDDTITWSEFQRWQRFTRLVLEHEPLASAMQRGDTSGEHWEVLKALTGDYASSFFDVNREPVSSKEAEWMEREKLRHPEIVPMILEGQQHQEKERRKLWTWFQGPPGKFCSIEWIPKRKEDADAVLPLLRKGGAMIEFLLPRKSLRPAFVIHPWTTLHAIAAAIYADYSNGVEYRTCQFCNRLFPVGRQKSKKFCNQRQCKNAAHSRKSRRNERERKMKAKAEEKLREVPTDKAKQR